MAESKCDIQIRVEEVKDYRSVEELTREAFWNLHVQGADEHFLLHNLRQSDCFIPALSLVAVIGDTVVGHISYSNCEIIGDDGSRTEAVTFGPVSVLLQYQGKGVGSTLIRHSIQAASDLGHKAIIILGYPCLYKRFGFKNSHEYKISYSNGNFMKSLQVLELVKGGLEGVHGRFAENPVFDIDNTSAEFAAYDATFPSAEKYVTVSQGVFQEIIKLKYNDPDPVDCEVRCHCRDRIATQQP